MGPEPPYHNPVFVLTDHERAFLEMQGCTTFHFVTGGITEALEQAQAAAGDQDVAIAGRCCHVNQFLAAGLIDELRLHIAPVASTTRRPCTPRPDTAAPRVERRVDRARDVKSI